MGEQLPARRRRWRLGPGHALLLAITALLTAIAYPAVQHAWQRHEAAAYRQHLAAAMAFARDVRPPPDAQAWSGCMVLGRGPNIRCYLDPRSPDQLAAELRAQLTRHGRTARRCGVLFTMSPVGPAHKWVKSDGVCALVTVNGVHVRVAAVSHFDQSTRQLSGSEISVDVY